MAAAVSLPGLLAERRPVALDGGLATELEARGHDLSDALWSARLLRDAPEELEAVHLAFLRAGARIVETASYQASVEGFARAGLSEAEAEELLADGVALARRAGERLLAERPDAAVPLVAASVGPYGAMLAGGQEYSGDYGDATVADVARFHERRLRVLVAAGPDCIACETLPRADEAAVLAGLLDALDAPPAWLSFTCGDAATLAGGEPIEDGVAAATGSARVVAVGVNCTSPEHVAGALRRMRAATDLPLVAYPNSGRVWDGSGRRWRTTGVDRLPGELVRAWVDEGASIVGGCCGVGPGAIRAIAGVLATPRT